MKRLVSVAVMLMAVAAMGKTPTADPMPGACDVLQAIDIAATLGPGTTYTTVSETENDMARVSVCSADTPDLARRMTLLVRESLEEIVPDAATLKENSTTQLRGVIGEDAVIDEVAIGDAATWIGGIGQLTIWHRAGRVVLIFSPTPMLDRAAAEAAALKALAAYP